MPTMVGTVAALARFPVKSMLGDEPAEVHVGVDGLCGDRAYALVDRSDGVVASAKNPRKWGRLLGLRARFVDEPEPGGPLPPVEIADGHGLVGRSDDPGIDDALTKVVGRSVTLARSAPDDRRFEEVWPDIAGLAPDDFVAGTTIGWETSGEAVSEIELGQAAPPGTFFDVSTLHLLTTATLASLRALEPTADFDWRRYRPNVLVDSGPDGGGFPENGWGGAAFRLGATVEAAGLIPTMRCVMTTLAHGDVPADRVTLQAIARHNRVDIPGLGTWACAGAYASVTAPGTLAVGDPVEQLPGG